MNYTGLDCHKQHIHFQHMSEDGYLMNNDRIATSANCLNNLFDSLAGPTHVTLEAGRNWWWITQLLLDHPQVSEVSVVDARRSRRLAEELSVRCGYGRAKTDRIDAQMLAEQTRHNLAPGIYIPSVEQLQRRSIVRYRSDLVHQHTSLVSILQSLFALHGLRLSIKSLIESWEKQLPFLEVLSKPLLFLIKERVEQIKQLREHIKRCNIYIEQLIPEKEPRLQLLSSLPGFGPVLTRQVDTEIITIERFESDRHLISYSGLAPIEQESAGRKGVIKLNPHCNYYLKNAFMMAAHCARHHSKYCSKYQRDLKKRGKKIAKINLARKLVKAVYWMLTRQQPFK
jgi:transposase